jgi:hypothetical protein
LPANSATFRAWVDSGAHGWLAGRVSGKRRQVILEQSIPLLKCKAFHRRYLLAWICNTFRLAFLIRLRCGSFGKALILLKTVTSIVESGYYFTCSSGIDSDSLYRF